MLSDLFGRSGPGVPMSFTRLLKQQRRELSQVPVLKKALSLNVRVEDLKLLPIVQFAAIERRSQKWENVVTCHENEFAAYVWRLMHRTIGKNVQ